MELLRELFLTGILAVLFSFLIAKLVSMAMSGGDSSPDSQSGNVDREVVTAEEVVGEEEEEEEEEKVIMEELVFRERLEVEGFKSATKAESVEQLTEKVREFVAESFPAEDVKESANREEIIEAEARELAQELIDAIVREEEKKLKGVDFDNEEVKQVNLDSSIKEKREEEPSGIELDVVEEVGVVETDSQEKVQEKKVEIEVEDEDDGWEGIERSELEKVFAEAAKFVEESGDKDERLTSIGSDVQMELYGLHKIATEGPCREQPPMALKVSARAKWNAWQRLGNMSPEVAMEQYVALVSDRAPGWMEDQPIGEDKPGSSKAANPVSVTPVFSTSPSQQNFTDERNTKPKLAAEDSDLTGGSDLENRPKE